MPRASRSPAAWANVAAGSVSDIPLVGLSGEMRTPTRFGPQTPITAAVTSRSSLARLRGLPP